MPESDRYSVPPARDFPLSPSPNGLRPASCNLERELPRPVPSAESHQATMLRGLLGSQSEREA